MTAPAGAAIAAWEDEPFGAILERQPPMNEPVHRPVPDFDVPGLPVGIVGTHPRPDVYKADTPEFRYWALAEALVRSAGFWSRVLPGGVTWHPDNGPRLN